MGEMRTWEITTTHRVTIDTESWGVAFGLDPANRGRLGEDVAGWLGDAVHVSLAPDVDGTVTRSIVTEPHEVTSEPHEAPTGPRMTVEYAEKHRGCWIESSHGWKAAGHLVAMAEERGMPLDDNERAVVKVYLAGGWTAEMKPLTLPNGEMISLSDVGEYVTGQGELRDKAEAWLNEHVTPDGWAFGWYDSEFMLWPNDEWEEVAE